MPKYLRPWQHADRKMQAPVQPPGPRPLNDGCVDWRSQGPAAEVLAMPAPAPRKPQPKLEINRIPVKDLHALIEKVGELGVCRQLNVHQKTLYRWRTGRVPIPGHQHQVIRLLLGEPVASCFRRQLMVWPSLGFEIVGATVTFAVSVVVKTFDKAQFSAIAVALKATALGGVCALLGMPAEKSVIDPGTRVVIHSLSAPSGHGYAHA